MMKLIGHRSVVVTNVATHWHGDFLATFVIVRVVVAAAFDNRNTADQK